MLKSIFILVLASLLNIFAQDETVEHRLTANVNPANSFISVVDTIFIEKDLSSGAFTFLLNSNLSLTSHSPQVKIETLKGAFSPEDLGMDRETDETMDGLMLKKYEVRMTDFSSDESFFVVSYEGEIKSEIKQSAENYQRGFSQSPGIISSEGVYLAGSTYWVPVIEKKYFSFRLNVQLPEDWKSVSQGRRIAEYVESGNHYDTWLSNTPQEEVFLIAAKFSEYHENNGAVDIYAFLRTPDDGLANKYIEVTSQYMEMYRQLIGPFPYSKFALVENFWETGYGMPSFTLLGQKIIRFPFILHSSYPHELLHNWWGNSVYVDFDKGNWCEGLTAYMADHLIKEQRGQGAEYRRSTLQKYTDLVGPDNDFPLNQFISRFDGPSEAIGYGKSLMMFHMLRNMVGDELFTKAFQLFNRNYKFKKASFDDIRKSFEMVSGNDLKWFFSQWVNRTGAPEIELKNVGQNEESGKFNVKFNLIQNQDDPVFIVDVPIAFVTEDETTIKIFRMKSKNASFTYTSEKHVAKIIVDPEYDVFRILDNKEIPAAFTKAYGAGSTTIIIPDNEKQELYKEFANKWIGNKKEKYKVVLDSKLENLPVDESVWILDYTNKFLPLFNKSIMQFHSYIRSDSVKLDYSVTPVSTNSFFITVKDSRDDENSLVFLSIGMKEAIDGLVRKLPHYGKYSYLAFEGDEPANIVKGIWQVNDSPMIKVLEELNVEIKLPKRKALANLAPVFSSKRMMADIAYFSSDELKGRGVGTEGIDKAADYIINKFKEIGLLPGSDDGTYVQEFEENLKGVGLTKMKNIVGIIPGNNPKLKDQAVIVSAHYDHLGLGYPDVHKGDRGKIHNGADDNASGVSVMLELARTLSKSFKPSRTIIFVAFSGEEEGLLGSKYFVENYKRFPVKKMFADLNLDTVGRLFGKKLMILNGSTSPQWRFIFMGAEYTTGVASVLIQQELDASDQVSFINKGIPAVQFFSGPNEDYHRPSDTADKIDPAGLVKTATLVKEVLTYLTEREEPLDFKSTSAQAKVKVKVSSGKSGRRVSTGIMPDFAFNGKGVKVAAVSDGSPSSKAGILVGDVIVEFDNSKVENLRDYSNLLKKHSPGDKVEAKVDREGKIIEIELILQER